MGDPGASGIASGLTICGRDYEDYLEAVEAFHGHVAPGMILGGLLVDLAWRNRPSDGLLDAICETRHCLPDAVQLLTPCTVGNGWLRIVDLGRFALTLYDKQTGEGVRAFVTAGKLEPWPEIRTFLFKAKPKREQDTPALLAEILAAGASFLGIQHVVVNLDGLPDRRRAEFVVCPECGEGYPAADGGSCLGCRGEAPYVPGGPVKVAERDGETG
jgi:formylmethanofuran dehydrogenase subunit E